MKALFIGGTGTISTAISEKLLESGCELTLLNRGNRSDLFPNCEQLLVDINDEERVAELTAGREFDVVVDFIAFTTEHVGRDYRLFRAKTRQYIFVSSASAYEKPPKKHIITEETPLDNPFWEYSRNKIDCEEYLYQRYTQDGFPVTIVRPSHTYNERSVPLGVHGNGGSWQVLQRMLLGKPVIIHGDGTSLWTMTHSNDFADGFIGLMGNKAAIGEAIQITSDEVLTWNQIYADIASALGVELKAVHVASETLAAMGEYDFTGSLIGDKANCAIFDNSKLKRLVPSFCAVKSFAVGIKETVDYVLAHEQYQIPDPDFDAWCDNIVKITVELQ